VKIVEVPPGPPVLSPLVAEVYGLDYAGQIQVAKQLRGLFESTPDIVDVDDSVEAAAPQLHLHVDRARANILGVSQAAVVDALATALGGSDVAYLHSAGAKYPIPLRLEFPAAGKDQLERLFALKLTGRDGRQVALADLVTIEHAEREHAIYHKDLLPMVMVTGDMAGDLDSPLYGMFRMVGALRDEGLTAAGPGLEQFFVNQPDNPYQYSDQVGRRMAGHLRDLPRYGHRLFGGTRADLPAGGRAVPLLSGAADHHGADSADGHRRDAGPCPVRRSSPRRP
jgi:multidrug efflux pump subunit AcrB